jgi:CO/xanthine dehydrogenase Mo-binding subunit
VKAQIEGGILFALSAALKEQITVTGGAIQQQNFNSYALLRITDSPALETYVLSSARPPGGIGEAGGPGIAPSVANAVFTASGKRLRRLPFDLNRDLYKGWLAGTSSPRAAAKTRVKPTCNQANFPHQRKVPYSGWGEGF